MKYIHQRCNRKLSNIDSITSYQYLFIQALTVKASIGVNPPPAAMFPGCGAPCGGNKFTGGGANATAAKMAVAAIAVSKI